MGITTGLYHDHLRGYIMDKVILLKQKQKRQYKNDFWREISKRSGCFSYVRKNGVRILCQVH